MEVLSIWQVVLWLGELKPCVCLMIIISKLACSMHMKQSISSALMLFFLQSGIKKCHFFHPLNWESNCKLLDVFHFQENIGSDPQFTICNIYIHMCTCIYCGHCNRLPDHLIMTFPFRGWVPMYLYAQNVSASLLSLQLSLRVYKVAVHAKYLKMIWCWSRSRAAGLSGQS